MVAADIALTREKTGYFYVWMAGVCALIAFGAFAPTYWMQLPGATFIGPPLLHVHALLFSAWTLLLLSQTMLAATGRLEHHKAWGLAGISLASVMVVVGATVAVMRVRAGLAQYGDAMLAFLILPLSGLALFAGFFIAAIANLNRPEVHKRLVLLATISLLEAAMARVFFVIATGGGPGARPGLGPPPSVTMAILPSMLLELLIIAACIRDWRVRGRPHPVWIIGGVLYAVVVFARVPFSASAPWLAFANGLAHIGG
jgi:hypothetical protein